MVAVATRRHVGVGTPWLASDVRRGALSDAEFILVPDRDALYEVVGGVHATAYGAPYRKVGAIGEAVRCSDGNYYRLDVGLHNGAPTSFLIAYDVEVLGGRHRALRLSLAGTGTALYTERESDALDVGGYAGSWQELTGIRPAVAPINNVHVVGGRFNNGSYAGYIRALGDNFFNYATGTGSGWRDWDQIWVGVATDTALYGLEGGVYLCAIWDKDIGHDRMMEIMRSVGDNSLRALYAPPRTWFLLGAGGTVYTVDHTDGIVFDDPDTRGIDALRRDSILLGDGALRIVERLREDSLLIGDQALVGVLRQHISTDKLMISDQAVRGVERNMLDALLLADALFRVAELVRLDPVLLADSVLTEVVSGGAVEITQTDGLLMGDEHGFTVELARTDGALLSDATFRTVVKELIEGLLMYDTLTTEKRYERAAIDRLLVSEALIKAWELLRLDPVLISDSVSTLLTQPTAAALVWAKLQGLDPLLRTTGHADVLGRKVGSEDPLGRTISYVRQGGYVH